MKSPEEERDIIEEEAVSYAKSLRRDGKVPDVYTCSDVIYAYYFARMKSLNEIESLKERVAMKESDLIKRLIANKIIKWR